MMSCVLLLLSHLLAFSQSIPEPDTHLHVHLPPETGGQGKTSPNTAGGGLVNGAPSGKDKDEIAGGVPAYFWEFPYLPVFYHNPPTQWTGGCAGALISPRHVITCWHCFQDKVSKVTRVGFAKTNREDDDHVVKYRVQRFVFHPTLDVGILVLKDNVVNFIKPIRLPEYEDGCNYDGQIITIVGPGATGLPGTANVPKSVFMKVDLKAFTGNETTTGKTCTQWEGREFVCATSLKKEPWGSGSPGDSGAAMMICRDREGLKPRDCTLVGVLTGGSGENFKSDSAGPCVSALRPWIDVVMKETTGEKWSLGGKDDDDNYEHLDE